MTRSGYVQVISSHHLIHHITSQLSEPYLKFTKILHFVKVIFPVLYNYTNSFPGVGLI